MGFTFDSQLAGSPASGSLQPLIALSTQPVVAPAPEPRLRHSSDPRVRHYGSTFADLMEMRAPAAVVAAYLDRHEGWFRRCAAPMAVHPLGGALNGLSLIHI